MVDYGGERRTLQLRRAEALLSLGRAGEAIGLIEQVVAANPGDDGALGLLALAHLRAGNDAQCLHAVEAALQIDAGWADLHRFASVALTGLGDLEAAAAAAERAVRLNPDSAASHTQLAFALANRAASGCLERGLLLRAARQAADRALELDPHDTDALRARGFVEEVQGNRGTALDYQRQILAIDPFDRHAATEVALAPYTGSADRSLGPSREAMTKLSGTLRADPLNPVALTAAANLGRAMATRMAVPLMTAISVSALVIGFTAPRDVWGIGVTLAAAGVIATFALRAVKVARDLPREGRIVLLRLLREPRSYAGLILFGAGTAGIIAVSASGTGHSTAAAALLLGSVAVMIGGFALLPLDLSHGRHIGEAIGVGLLTALLTVTTTIAWAHPARDDAAQESAPAPIARLPREIMQPGGSLDRSLSQMWCLQSWFVTSGVAESPSAVSRPAAGDWGKVESVQQCLSSGWYAAAGAPVAWSVRDVTGDYSALLAQLRDPPASGWHRLPAGDQDPSPAPMQFVLRLTDGSRVVPEPRRAGGSEYFVPGGEALAQAGLG